MNRTTNHIKVRTRKTIIEIKGRYNFLVWILTGVLLLSSSSVVFGQPKMLIPRVQTPIPSVPSPSVTETVSSIHVLSPNGGETWFVLSPTSYEIRWQSYNLPSKTVTISIYQLSTGMIRDIYVNSPDDGSQFWVPDKNFPASSNDYKVIIRSENCTNNNSSASPLPYCISDMSDQPFSILYPPIIACTLTGINAHANPSEGLAPLTVQFKAVAFPQPPTCGELIYTWDFGDGSGIFYGQNPTHVYQKEGVYTATVTATAYNRTVQSNIQIRVRSSSVLNPYVPQNVKAVADIYSSKIFISWDPALVWYPDILKRYHVYRAPYIVCARYPCPYKWTMLGQSHSANYVDATALPWHYYVYAVTSVSDVYRNNRYYYNIESDKSSPSNFVVVGENPTVTLLVPNGGEKWTKGETYRISWKTNRAHPNTKISLWAYPVGTSTLTNIVVNTENDGSYDWTIPLNYYKAGPNEIVISNCQFLVSGDPNQFCFYDKSDHPFFIKIP